MQLVFKPIVVLWWCAGQIALFPPLADVLFKPPSLITSHLVRIAFLLPLLTPPRRAHHADYFSASVFKGDRDKHRPCLMSGWVFQEDPTHSQPWAWPAGVSG